MLEDLLDIQSAYGLRSEYTREAGYALARDLDNSVLALRAAISNYPSQVIYNTTGANAGLVNGTAAPINYSSLLTAKTILDASDVPSEDRALLVSPQQYNALLAVDKFINTWYTNADYPVNTGMVGRIFDIPVFMTSQLGNNSATGYLNGSGSIGLPTPGVTGSPYLPVQDSYTGLATVDGASNPFQTAILCHKDWAIMAVQADPMTEASRQALYLADVVTMSQLYGCKVYRPDHAVIIYTSNTIPAIS